MNNRARRVSAISCVSEPVNVSASAAARGFLHGAGEIFFSRTKIDQRLQAVLRKFCGHFSVTFSRPLLGSPASARGEQRELLCALRFQAPVAFLFGMRRHAEARTLGILNLLLSDRFCE